MPRSPHTPDTNRYSIRVTIVNPQRPSQSEHSSWSVCHDSRQTHHSRPKTAKGVPSCSLHRHTSRQCILLFCVFSAAGILSHVLLNVYPRVQHNVEFVHAEGEWCIASIPATPLRPISSLQTHKHTNTAHLHVWVEVRRRKKYHRTYLPT